MTLKKIVNPESGESFLLVKTKGEKYCQILPSEEEFFAAFAGNHLQEEDKIRQLKEQIKTLEETDVPQAKPENFPTQIPTLEPVERIEKLKIENSQKVRSLKFIKLLIITGLIFLILILS